MELTESLAKLDIISALVVEVDSICSQTNGCCSDSDPGQIRGRPTAAHGRTGGVKVSDGSQQIAGLHKLLRFPPSPNSLYEYKAGIINKFWITIRYTHMYTGIISSNCCCISLTVIFSRLNQANGKTGRSFICISYPRSLQLNAPLSLSKARLSSWLALAMDDLTSNHQLDQSRLHVDQSVAASIPDNYPQPLSSSSPNSIPSLSDSAGQNSSLSNDPGISSVPFSLPDQHTSPTASQTVIRLTPPPEERGAGTTTNPDQHVHSIGLVDNIPTKDDREAIPDHVNGQIELLEGSPDTTSRPGNSDLIVEESQEWTPDVDHELKRVKVSSFISTCLNLSASWLDQCYLVLSV